MSSEVMKPVARPQEVCKICGGHAELYGVVDFNKNCEELRRKVLTPCGVPIYYHQCRVCDFVFTTAFDKFAHEDFARYIYNNEYHLVDPDFASARPQANGGALSQMFSGHKHIRILDYGGGNGFLAAALRKGGFADVHVYDPFVPEHAVRPEGTFDLITSFEVLEHTPRPLETARDMASLLSSPGLLLFSTLLRTGTAVNEGVNWWYIGPRNGHVSIFSRPSLNRLTTACGLACGSFNENLHAAFRQVPPFARHLIPSPPPVT